MPWNPTDKEIEAVLQLAGPKRYAYWLKKVADEHVVWSLWQPGGWALVANDSGQQLVPVWPHETFAEKCADGIWSGFVPKQIEMDVWMEQWIPGMERDARLVAVFPSPNDRGVVVTPAKLAANLEEELSKYE